MSQGEGVRGRCRDGFRPLPGRDLRPDESPSGFPSFPFDSFHSARLHSNILSCTTLPLVEAVNADYLGNAPKAVDNLILYASLIMRGFLYYAQILR